MKIMILAMLSILSYQCGAQFVVTYVKGKVTCNGRMIQIRDKIAGTEKLRSSDKSALVGLIHPELGKVLISFSGDEHVKLQSSSDGWYEIVLGEFIKKYTSEKVLTTRDATFDLYYFLTDASNDSNNKILLLQGQDLPLQSSVVRDAPGDKYYVCVKNETNCSLLRKRAGTIKIDLPQFKDTGTVVCTFEKRFLINGKEKIQAFPLAVEVSIRNSTEIKSIISLFYQNLQTVYKGDISLFEADIYDHLHFFYGKFYEKDIDKLILSVIGR